MNKLSDEARVFKLHLDVFVNEDDCNCVMDAMSDSKLIDAKVLDVIRHIPDAQTKNRLFIEKVVKIVNPHNFALVCFLFHSKPCFRNFVHSIIGHLAMFQCIDAVANESVQFDTFLRLLCEQNFFSEAEQKIIECHSHSKQKAFIDVLKKKPVVKYYFFQTFMDFLRITDSKLEDLIVGKKNDLREIIFAYYLISSRDSASLTHKYFNVLPYQSTVTDFPSDSALDQRNILDQYYRYLKNWYLTLPEVSLQGWYDSNINSKKFTDITIIYCIEKERTELYTASEALLSEIEYSVHKCKTYDEIFKYGRYDCKQLILIEGNAGTGKTTFAQNICKKWSSGNMLTDYSFVILVCLRDQKPGDIKEPKNLFTKVGKTASDIHTELSTHPTKKVLFWLEGWDELHDSYKMHSVFTQLLTGEVFPQAVVVVSTRPLATTNLNNHNFVQKFNIVGFDKTQIEKCARSYFFNYYHDHSNLDLTFSKFINQLDSVHGLAQLAKVPLNLAIILKLFVHNKTLPSTLTDVYTSIVLVILQHHKNRNYPCRKAITSVDDLDMPDPMKSMLRGLEKHAYDSFLFQRPFSFEEIKQYISCPLDEKEFDGMGFFQIVEKKSITGESNSYLYRYKVIQEYLTAVYLTRLEVKVQKQELETIFGVESYEMVRIFYAGLTGMTRIKIHSVLPKLDLTSQSNVTLPVLTRRDVHEAWMLVQCHFMNMTRKTEFSVDFLLTLMLCCYEAENSEACKVITKHCYPINICRIEIPPNRASPYLLLAVSYFIAHSGRKWSLRCVSAIPSGVELLCKYINNPTDYCDDPGSLFVWCFVVKPCDIDAYIKAIKSQPSLQWVHLLDGSHLGDECTTKLCKCLKFDCNIIKVMLENCGIGGVGLKSIADMLKINHKILHVDIRKNKFSLDDFITFLLDIKETTHVEYLLVDKDYLVDAQVCEILQDINLKRSQKNKMMHLTDH